MRGTSPLWAPLIVVPPLLVLGHLVPKAIVQAHADRVVDVDRAPAAARVVRCCARSSSVVGGFAAALTRVTRTDREKAFVTRDELALLIESEPHERQARDQRRRARDDRERVRAVGVQGRRADGAAVRGHRAARGRADRRGRARGRRQAALAHADLPVARRRHRRHRPRVRHAPGRDRRRRERARPSRRSRTRRSTCRRR